MRSFSVAPARRWTLVAPPIFRSRSYQVSLPHKARPRGCSAADPIARSPAGCNTWVTVARAVCTRTRASNGDTLVPGKRSVGNGTDAGHNGRVQDYRLRA